MSTNDTAFNKYLSELRDLELPAWDTLEELATRGIAGDRTAFNSVVKALLPLVVSIVKDFKGITFDDREEMIQTGNIALMKTLRSWKPGGAALSTWVYRSIKRDMGRALSIERTFRKTHMTEEPDDNAADISSDDEVHTGDYKIEQVDDDPGVDPARVFDQMLVTQLSMIGLTDKESEVITMHYRRGFTFDAIAAYQGVSRQAISKLHKRALSRLRVYIS